jgi:hypothetical protein
LEIVELTPNGIKLANGESISFVNQPLSVANRPLSEANQPLSTVNQPLSTVNQPLSAANQPLSAANQPLSATNRPLSAAKADRMQAIIDFLENAGQARTRELTEIVGLSEGRVRDLLRAMVEDGTIDKVGSNRYACYRLKKEK